MCCSPLPVERTPRLRLQGRKELLSPFLDPAWAPCSREPINSVAMRRHSMRWQIFSDLCACLKTQNFMGCSHSPSVAVCYGDGSPVMNTSCTELTVCWFYSSPGIIKQEKKIGFGFSHLHEMLPGKGRGYGCHKSFIALKCVGSQC